MHLEPGECDKDVVVVSLSLITLLPTYTHTLDFKFLFVSKCYKCIQFVNKSLSVLNRFVKNGSL